MSKQPWPILPMMQNSPPRSTRQTTPEDTRTASKGQTNVLVAVMNSYIDDSDNVHQNKLNVTGNLAREIEGAACTAHDVRQAHWVPCASRTRQEPAASTGAIASTVA